jgi:hypothetical protein
MVLTLQNAVESISSLKSSGDPAGQVNLACERLYSFGKFKNLVKPLYLKVYEEGTITLPQDYETLLGARIKGVPQRLHDPWFQFVPSGNGYSQAEPGIVSLDLGDGHICYRSASGATDLRLVSSGADAAKTFTATVRTTEDMGIAAQVLTVTGALGDFGSTFGLEEWLESVTAFTKEPTSALVSLEAEIDGSWDEVARFAPNDTEICLRKYSLPQGLEDDVVLAYSKRRFRPVSRTTDALPIDSIYVLRLALEALDYEMSGDLKLAPEYWALARKALDDSLSEHRSSAGRTMPVYCRAAAGAGLRAIR